MAATSIPMTRLGGRAFAHSSKDDVEAEYDRLRALAREEAAKRSSCFDRAHDAYARGDGAEAKALSDEGKRHAAKMDQYNRQASEYIFRENNAPGRVAEDSIDLHGQFVEEAEDILEARIRDAQARGQTHLHVIVGKGNHSANHVQRIKPRVEQVCRELGLQFATEDNDGRIYVDLTGAPVSGAPPRPPQTGGGYGGGAGYAHGGQQQHHQQQHHQQQQQQPDEIEQIVNKVLPKFLQKLEKACCIVM
ncbi:Smr domain protein [Pleurostoma richardsiae]|uniref:Smr domain protein n=1 Tax=Pleurostoma richardsiae TaxID=41990 RepID=A0AA38VNG6_9PEZI|nr:Smr domain protein [Pleurostoma richardsiae]